MNRKQINKRGVNTKVEDEFLETIDKIQKDVAQSTGKKQPKRPAQEKPKGTRREVTYTENKIEGKRQKEHVKKKKEIQKVSLFRYGLEVLLNKATKGNLDNPTADFEITYNHIMSELHNKVVYQLIEYDYYIPFGYLSQIKDEVLASIPNAQETNTDIFICHHIKHHRLNVNTPKMKETLRALKSRQKKLEQQCADLRVVIDNIEIGTSTEKSRAEDILANYEKVLLRRERKINSFEIVRDHQEKGGAYASDYIFLEVVSSDLEIQRVLCENLEARLDSLKIIYKNITLDLDKYLLEYGPASFVHKKRGALDVIPMYTTSTVLATDLMYNSGIIRGALPEINIGVNFNNNYPVDICLTEGTDAVNILVEATTRSGKSQLCANIINYSKLHFNKYRRIIKDYKGNEWSKDLNLDKDHVTIYFNASQTPMCVNTYIIPQKDLVNYSSRKALYDLCHRVTTLSLLALVAPPTDKYVDYLNVCSEIVSNVYSEVGVIRDIESSYSKSENIKFKQHTWGAIKNVTGRMNKSNSLYSADVLRNVLTALNEFFSPSGARSDRFQHEVSIYDILQTSTLCIDMGKLTSGAPLMPNEEAMLEIQSTFLTDIYTFNNHALGYTTIEIMEELNTALNNPATASRLADILLTQACCNKVNFLISNSSDFLLDKNVSKDVLKIRDALNGVIIGSCQSPDNVIKFFKLYDVADLIYKASQDDGIYKYAFYAYIPGAENKIKTMIKLPYTKEYMNRVMEGKKVDTELDYREDDL